MMRLLSLIGHHLDHYQLVHLNRTSSSHIKNATHEKISFENLLIIAECNWKEKWYFGLSLSLSNCPLQQMKLEKRVRKIIFLYDIEFGMKLVVLIRQIENYNKSDMFINTHFRNFFMYKKSYLYLGDLKLTRKDYISL